MAGITLRPWFFGQSFLSAITYEYDEYGGSWKSCAVPAEQWEQSNSLAEICRDCGGVVELTPARGFLANLFRCYVAESGRVGFRGCRSGLVNAVRQCRGRQLLVPTPNASAAKPVFWWRPAEITRARRRRLFRTERWIWLFCPHAADSSALAILPRAS